VLVTREIRTRYRTSVLDIAWAVITPVVLMVVYGLILTQSFNVTGSCAPYLSSAWTGLVVWTAFSTALGGAVSSLVASSNLINKVYFPLEAIPLAIVGASLLDLAVGLASLVVLVLVQGVHLELVGFAAVLPVAVLILWSAILSMLTAVLAVFARDVIHAVGLGLRVGFFATPVMYETGFLPGSLAWTAKLNPVAVAINGIRDAVLCGRSPNLALVGIHLAGGVAVFFLVVSYIRAIEPRVVDVA
jgi:ABC-type polysaccharide/polyol phosphate export permease